MRSVQSKLSENSEAPPLIATIEYFRIIYLFISIQWNQYSFIYMGKQISIEENKYKARRKSGSCLVRLAQSSQ
jgi:hypothetical protein